MVRYAGASTDFNPIHYSEHFAKQAGLPVIAHGMLTMGTALRVVTNWVGDPSRVTAYSARFTRPVVVPDDADGVEVEFSASVSAIEGSLVTVSIDAISNGRKARCGSSRSRSWRAGPASRSWNFPCALSLSKGEMRRQLSKGRPMGLRQAQPAAPQAPCWPTTRRCGLAVRHVRMITVETEAELVQAVRDLDATGQPVLVLGGGSNLLISDAGFDGTVVKIAMRGFDQDTAACSGAVITVAAGKHGIRSCATLSNRAGAASKRCPGSRAWSVPHRSKTSARTGPRSAS